MTVLEGDCLERLGELDDDSIDAVVTDPPYGLSAEPDATEVMCHWLEGDDYQHRGGGFMGKTWDSFVPGPTVWKECLRVLKPGGHLVAFFGTRTVDLGGMAIRLAGFEIRDCLAWHYGSGFPKSLDVSKAMDKAAGAERKVIGHTDPHDPRTAMARKMYGTDLQDEPGQGIPITEAATAEAAQWAGWGTALKPAFEPIILARKPLIGTVAENVTRYGTGALNVDGCRVGFASEADRQESTAKNQHEDFGTPPLTGNTTYGDYSMVKPKNYNPPGRWPANLVLDDQAAAMLDEQSGETSSNSGTYKRDRTFRPGTDGQQGFAESENIADYGDTGGASRFFYQAKASRAERNAGLDGLPEREVQSGMAGGAIPIDDRGADRDRFKVVQSNVHPTVKPIDLMRWLVRLVTPPGGTVLDPFTGSGTTGIAAGLEGFKFVGIEREPEYREIAEARLQWWAEQEGETAEILQRAGLAEKERAKAEAAGQTSLFEEAA